MREISDKCRTAAICAALIVVPLAVFWQVHNFDFVNYDDDVYVSKNERIFSGFTGDNVKWLFTRDVGRWHPLAGLTHMLDCELFGLNPGWHHLTNLFLHIANTLLLFAVLKRATGSLWRSAFVAGLFAIHPLHVESVAWVSGRKDLLSTLFWILTIGVYFRYVEKHSISWYAAALLCFTLGLLAKPMIVTLPFVLLLFDYWPLNRVAIDTGTIWRRTAGKLILEKIPFFVIACGASIITFVLFGSVGQVQSIEALPLAFRINNAIISYMKYIGKMIWPAGLAANYPYSENIMPVWQAIITAVFLAAITIRIIGLGKKYKYLPVGWFMFLGTLVPVIGLIQISDLAMADRYTYLSLTGLFIIVAWGGWDFAENWKQRKKILGFASILIFVVFTYCAYIQTGYWRNSMTLFGHAVNVTSENYLAYNNLAAACNETGQYDAALACANKALEINPKYSKAYGNRGLSYFASGKYDLAISDFNKAVELNPKDADAYYNRGTFYSQVESKYDLAIADFNKVLELNPRYPKAHNNRGISYYRKGEYDLAISDYNKELQINPLSADAYTNRGNAYWQGKGRADLAIADYDKAIGLNPMLVGIYFNKAGACESAGLTAEAVKAYEAFIEYAPAQLAPNIEQAKQRIKELQQQNNAR